MAAQMMAQIREGISSDQLAEAFGAFERASQTMADQYEALRKRVAELDLELEEKNRRLEKSLDEKEAFGRYLESLLEGLSNGVMAVTADSKVATINHAAETILGVDRNAILGHRLADTFPTLLESNAVCQGIANGLGQTRAEALEFTDASGNLRVIEVQFRRVSPLPDQAPHGLIVIRDVTEIRRLERAASLRDRLTAMGQMAMNVAHEVRNPLGSIELFASALRQDLEDEPDRRRLVDFICQGVRGVDNIVGNILMFARQASPSLERVSPVPLLDDVLTYARFHIEQKEVALERRDLSNGAQLWGDIELLKQVFLNLLLNATQAMNPGGTLTLKTKANAKHIIFVVADTGSGVEPENIDKIFDPFVTTKRRGTGLGLTICHNIVQAHQGTIEVKSELGVGTSFIIRIPRA